jgi:hypothetical protein
VSDDSLFREVDEEVRQEQFKKLWERYGNVVVGLCVAVVVGVAGFKGWQAWQLRQAEMSGQRYFAMATLAGKQKYDDALKLIPTIDQAGYGALAKFREAGILIAQGKSQEAVTRFDAMAADAALDPALRDLARIRAGYALADTASPAELAARVASFDAAGNPWRHAAREIELAATWKAKDYANADRLVKTILADPETPQGLRQRATMLSDLLQPLLPKS